MAKGKCIKCNYKGRIVKHHILPQCEFNSETVELCSNCHDFYHYDFIGSKNLKNKTEKFHRDNFKKFLTMVILLIFVFLGFLIF